MAKATESKKVDTKKAEKQSTVYSFQKLLPNILTLGALCSGLTALRFAIEGHFDYAVLCVVFAALLDNLDGRVARLVGANSGFGAELDSLADFVSFGAVPAMMLYLWSLNTLGKFGWMISLVFCICGGLRLARFNTQSTKTPGASSGPSAYFTGTPIPAAAGFVMFPMMLAFALEDSWPQTPYIVAPLMLIASALMISRIPTYSFKKAKIPYKFVLPLLLLVGFFAAMISASPWYALIGIVVLYTISIPLSIKAARKAKAS